MELVVTATLLTQVVLTQITLPEPLTEKQQPQNCQFDEVSFTTDFAAGRLHHCQAGKENRYILYLRPEREKINPSPWYAFRIHNPTDTTTTYRLTLVASRGIGRYTPKRSDDKQTWQALSFEEGDGRISFDITLAGDTKVYVAGQEIMDNVGYIDWLSTLLKNPAQQRVISLGVSSEGRNLAAIEHKAPNSDRWLILIGRQHPPEITGALALQHFGQLLFSDEPDAQAFRQRYNILLVPNMNPDGVYHGNWRLTATGVDMNRDWQERTQPETQALFKYLEALYERGDRIELAIDFHSTRRDVFYTMPSDYKPSTGIPLKQPERVREWLDEVINMVSKTVELDYKAGSHPKSGVFKQFITDHYGAPAVTYEVGDDSDRDNIKMVAAAALQTLIERLMPTQTAAEPDLLALPENGAEQSLDELVKDSTEAATQTEQAKKSKSNEKDNSEDSSQDSSEKSLDDSTKEHSSADNTNDGADDGVEKSNKADNKSLEKDNDQPDQKHSKDNSDKDDETANNGPIDNPLSKAIRELELK